jgi:hypothetical protein
MRFHLTCAAALLAIPLAALQAAPVAAQQAPARPAAAGQNPEAEAEFIKAAEEGAPEQISTKAAIARLEPSGATAIVRPGSNGFTCTLMADESHTPACANAQGFKWLVAATAHKPAPPAGGTGVVYMAKGSTHFETPEGEIVMAPTGQTKSVREPPHWMLLTPLDPAATGIPTRPNAGGAYIMFAGTPYAHLMLYQDPKMLEKP